MYLLLKNLVATRYFFIYTLRYRAPQKLRGSMRNFLIKRIQKISAVKQDMTS